MREFLQPLSAVSLPTTTRRAATVINSNENINKQIIRKRGEKHTDATEQICAARTELLVIQFAKVYAPSESVRIRWMDATQTLNYRIRCTRTDLRIFNCVVNRATRNRNAIVITPPLRHQPSVKRHAQNNVCFQQLYLYCAQTPGHIQINGLSVIKSN